MSTAAALARIKDSLVTSAGGYLRNTVHIPGQTCAVCRGTRMNPGYDTCYVCGFAPTNAADRVASMIYAVDGSQSAKMMYGYKATPPIPALAQRVSSLAAVALKEHTGCARRLAGTACTHWATVPSLRNIGSRHPLRTILLNTISPKAEIEVAASQLARGKDERDRRTHDPGLYELRTTVAPGSHVLVIDDTWTSGAHAQSVATVLKQAGAEQVSLLAIARWLDSDDKSMRVFNEHIRPRPFDPNTCPWTGNECPPR